MYKISFIGIVLLLQCTIGFCQHGVKKNLFDGKTFKGWEGDTLITWQIKDGALVGGSLTETIPRNAFLATKVSYENFILYLRVKIVSTEGFANGGIQFNSSWVDNIYGEMVGYQADVGPEWWGALYDESRRGLLTKPDSSTIANVVKPHTWNDYRIKSNNGHIEMFLNGKQIVDFKEANDSIPQNGKIALQVHGGGKVQVYYEEIRLKKLP